MEKKKLLLVAVSVGVFLVIVVSAAILIFRPSGADKPTAVITEVRPAQVSRSATTDAADMVRDGAYGDLQNPGSTYSPIQENRIYINGEDGSEVLVDHTSDTGNTKTVINIPKPKTAAVPTAPAKPSVSKAPVKKAEPKPAASAAPPKKTYNDFWIQAGSFSTRERADAVKKVLDDKGISAIITNQDINGHTYYRVRVGPYTSQNEADYWLAMIKSIDGFKDSQIWESQSKR